MQHTLLLQQGHLLELIVSMEEIAFIQYANFICGNPVQSMPCRAGCEAMYWAMSHAKEAGIGIRYPCSIRSQERLPSTKLLIHTTI